MGGRHSTPSNSTENVTDVHTRVGPGVALPVDRSPRPVLTPHPIAADRVQTSAAAVPGPSRATAAGAGAPVPGGAHAIAIAKQRERAQRASAAATAHRRLVLDMLAASGVGGRAGATGGGGYRAASSNDSTPEDSPLNRTLLTSSSFPLHIFALRGKCTLKPFSIIIKKLHV